MPAIPRRVLFGAAYYAEYPEAGTLDRDLDLMRPAGVTLIRVGESVWSTGEPQNGKFELDWLQPVLDGAHGQRVNRQVVERYAEWGLVYTATARTRSSGSTPSRSTRDSLSSCGRCDGRVQSTCGYSRRQSVGQHDGRPLFRRGEEALTWTLERTSCSCAVRGPTGPAGVVCSSGCGRTGTT
jgi:hypothetical protein